MWTVSWRLYEYRGNIPARKRSKCRVPEPAVIVGAVVGGRSVSRKLVGADGGARFGAVRSKHGEMNRKGPRASRHGAAVLRCNVRAEHHGRLEYHPAWDYTWDIPNAHVPSRIQQRVSRVCALLCMRLLAFMCGEGAMEGGVGGTGPAIADGCAGVPAVRVVTVVAREGVALVLTARTQGAQEGTPDR